MAKPKNMEQRVEELLETCPTYLEIVNSQLSAEEAAA